MERQGDVTALDHAAAWINSMTANRTDRHVFAIDLDGTTIGAIGITSIDRENRSGRFWCWCHRAHRGRGTSSRAAATVPDWALGQRGLKRLELGHRGDYPSSGAVARAAGFAQEGVERSKLLIAGAGVDVVTYSRLITDPVPVTETFKLREGA